MRVAAALKHARRVMRTQIGYQFTKNYYVKFRDGY